MQFYFENMPILKIILYTKQRAKVILKNEYLFGHSIISSYGLSTIIIVKYKKQQDCFKQSNKKNFNLCAMQGLA